MYIALTQVILDIILFPILVIILANEFSNKNEDLRWLFDWIIVLELVKAILYVIAGPFWQVLLSAAIILWALYSKHLTDKSH